MDLKRGTPGFGIVLGIALVALGALVMIIGIWRTLILAALFGIGFFLGTVENKGEFLKNTANRLIPDKEAKVIDLKSELAREQEISQNGQAQADAAESHAETENSEE